MSVMSAPKWGVSGESFMVMPTPVVRPALCRGHPRTVLYGRTTPLRATRGPSMAAPRRIGAETSKTRAVLLDRAEELMIEEGYAAVTYRVLAARAGVTGGLVQYYFPTLDDLFVALLERRSERN